MDSIKTRTDLFPLRAAAETSTTATIHRAKKFFFLITPVLNNDFWLSQRGKIDKKKK